MLTLISAPGASDTLFMQMHRQLRSQMTLPGLWDEMQVCHCCQQARWHKGPPSNENGEMSLIFSLCANISSFDCLIGLKIRTDIDQVLVYSKHCYVLHMGSNTPFAEMSTESLFVLAWVLPEANLETRTQVWVVHLGGEPRKHWQQRGMRWERKQPILRALLVIVRQLLLGAAGAPPAQLCWKPKEQCRASLRAVLTERRQLGYLYICSHQAPREQRGH